MQKANKEDGAKASKSKSSKAEQHHKPKTTSKSRSGRHHRKADSGTSSDGDSLLSQSESNSESESAASDRGSSPARAKGKASKGRQSVQKANKEFVAKPSKAKHPVQAQHDGQAEQHHKPKTRSKSKANSRHGSRAGQPVAEGLNGQWLRKVAQEQSIAGENVDIAGSVAGIRHLTGTGACDAEARAFNVVVIKQTCGSKVQQECVHEVHRH